jgi:hypothetical protein
MLATDDYARGDSTMGAPLYLTYPSGSNVLWDYKISE